MAQKVLFVVDEFYPVTSAPAVRISSFIDELKDLEVSVLGGNSLRNEAESVSEKFNFYRIFRPPEKSFIKFASFLIRINFIAIFKTIQLRPKVTVISIPKYELLLSVPIIKIFSKKLVIDVRDSYNFINYEAYFSHFVPGFMAMIFGRLVKWSVGLLLQIAMLLADKVTAANIGIFNSLGKFKNKSVIVSNGVETGLFMPAENKVRRPGSAINLVYMGNFAEKDDFSWFEHLDEALKPKIVLHLIGEGRNRQKVADFLQQKKINYLYHGQVSHRELPTILSKMDAGIIFREKSVTESIPVVIYEFSSMNIPTVCNDCGLMADFIRSKKLGEVFSDAAGMNSIFQAMAQDSQYFLRYTHLHGLAVKEFSRKEQAVVFKAMINSL